MTSEIKEQSKIPVKELVGLMIPCGTCPFARNVVMQDDNTVSITCFQHGECIFDLNAPKEQFKCVNKELKDLCSHFILVE